jgi:NAD(P)-dependent dehydrogenase (short-subunit alcohol dehydrogenase family)
MLPDLAGRVAVVTGGASGIGEAVAALFRELGATVVVVDLTPAEGGSVVDVSDRASTEAFGEFVRSSFGRCDFLVNCAGSIATGVVTVVSEDLWDRTFDVNVKGVWLMSRAMIPLMPSGGSILNVSSAAGLRPIPDMPAYVAAKAAVVGLTRAMALDHAPDGIRVNCVCPGHVDTPMSRATQASRTQHAAEEVTAFSNYLIKRNGTVDELAQGIVALATNTYATGATLALDGGRTLH